jgi:hypothetical protein
LFRFSDSEGPFVDALRHEREDGGTGNSVEYIAVQRMRYQHAVAGDDVRVLRGSLGDNAAALHPRVVSASGNRLVLHQRRVKQLRGLDIRPAPAQIGRRHNADAAYCHWIIGERARLGKGENRWRRAFWRKSEITVRGRTARDLPIDHAFFDSVARHQLTADDEPSFDIRSALHPEFAQ